MVAVLPYRFATNGPMNQIMLLLVLGIDLEESIALGIRLRYEAGNCAIVVSIKGAFK